MRSPSPALSAHSVCRVTETPASRSMAGCLLMPRCLLQGGVGISEQDLARPFHSEKAHRLLATNTATANSSFNVF